MKFIIRGTLTLEASTIVEADSEDEAKEIAIQRSAGSNKNVAWVKDDTFGGLDVEYINEVEKLSE